MGKDYNNTITGADFENMVYPEFKGFHGNTYWSTLQNTESPFTVYSESDGVLCEYLPQKNLKITKQIESNPGFQRVIYLSYEIPAIRCFKPISQQGPNITLKYPY